MSLFCLTTVKSIGVSLIFIGVSFQSDGLGRADPGCIFLAS